jgi:hypothetical protein
MYRPKRVSRKLPWCLFVCGWGLYNAGVSLEQRVWVFDCSATRAEGARDDVYLLYPLEGKCRLAFQPLHVAGSRLHFA